MTRAGMAASHCSCHPHGKHMMRVLKRGVLGLLIMQCSRYGFTSYWT